MKLSLIIIITLFFNVTFSQNIAIEFQVNENTNDVVLSTSTKYNFILKDTESVYYNNNDSLSQFKYQSFIDKTEKIGELIKVRLSDNHSAYIKQDLFYKNYAKDSLLYNEVIINKKVVIGEHINLFNWSVIPDSEKVILGYKCQKATSSFRGRIYEAYFTNEISQYGGPWKFDGLPGFILSVKSQDNYFVIEPLKIILNGKVKNDIVNAYKEKKVISWNDFKNKFKEALEKQFKKLKAISENGEGGSIKITDKIEDLEIPEMKF